MAERTGVTYRLVTIEDVFNLPTPEMVGRCLHEMAAILQAMRATTDLLNATAEALDPATYGEKWLTPKWPGFMDWTDDDGGESVIDYKIGTGAAFKIRLKHTPAAEQESAE